MTGSPRVRARFHPGDSRGWVVVGLFVASLGAFFAIQLHLERENNTVFIGSAHSVQVANAVVEYHLSLSLARFVGLMAAGTCLVLRGRRRLFFVPAVVYSTLPLLTAGPALPCSVSPHTFVAVGSGWQLNDCSTYLSASGLGGAVVDLSLLLAPVAGLALLISSRAADRKGHPRSPWLLGLGSLGLCALVLWLAMWTGSQTAPAPYPWWMGAGTVVPLFLFGALLGSGDRRLIIALIFVPLLIQPLGWFPSHLSHGWFPSGWHGAQVLPPVAAAVLGAAWQPLAELLRRLQESRTVSWAVLNALNIADAVMTTLALRSQQATEANPVVRAIGLPLKVVLVAALSLFLAHIRPRALVWAILAMAGVLAWHLAGIVLNGG